jgi:hypothetical protein
MRIKKKHVLLESLLIDVTTEFTPVEKRIFKMLNKHYGDPMIDEEGKKSFTQWEVGAWLIETLNISYQEAYTISKTYFWNYKKLFGETSKLRKDVGIPYLFFEHFRPLIDKVRDSYNNDIFDNVVVDFDRDSGFEDSRNVHFWAGFKGFTLYIPMTNGRIENDTIDYLYIYSKQSDPRQIIVKGVYYPINNEGIKMDGHISEENWEKDVDSEKFMVSVNVTIGRDDQDLGVDKVINDFMVFNVPYPNPLTYETFKKTNESIVGDVIKKIGMTTFELHPDVGSINVNNQPDSQY